MEVEKGKSLLNDHPPLGSNFGPSGKVCGDRATLHHHGRHDVLPCAGGAANRPLRRAGKPAVPIALDVHTLPTVHPGGGAGHQLGGMPQVRGGLVLWTSRATVDVEARCGAWRALAPRGGCSAGSRSTVGDCGAPFFLLPLCFLSISLGAWLFALHRGLISIYIYLYIYIYREREREKC